MMPEWCEATAEYSAIVTIITFLHRGFLIKSCTMRPPTLPVAPSTIRLRQPQGLHRGQHGPTGGGGSAARPGVDVALAAFGRGVGDWDEMNSTSAMLK